MKNKEKNFKFSSKSKKLINAYLKEIQKVLTNAQASQAIIEEITEELRDHILQAYWKETEASSVRAKELQEILEAMGNPREVAAEYLLDRQDLTKQSAKPSPKKGKSPPSRRDTQPQGKPGALLALPIIIVIIIYVIMVVSFSHSGHNWPFFLGIADLTLLIPLIWYFLGWKKSKNLDKWRTLSPRRMQVYFIVSGVLVVHGGIILPFLRGKFRGNQSPLVQDTLTLSGIYYLRSFNTEFWIKSRIVILANVIQLSLVVLFLVAIWKAPISWKQLDIRFDLLDVKLPNNINETGELVVRTTNFSAMTFAQVRMEILEQTAAVQTSIDPATRSIFGAKDAVTWSIYFTPKIVGPLFLGRIALKLDEKQYGYSPRYCFNAWKKAKALRPNVVASSLKTGDNHPLTLDFTGCCGICEQSFAPSDLTQFCTSCGSLFHQTHLQEWLKGHNKCPNCAKVINVSTSEYTYIQLIFEQLKRLENESESLKTILDNLGEASEEIMQAMSEF